MKRKRIDVRRHFLRETLQNAILSVDNACGALARGEKRAFNDHIWKAAFYLEYLTFMLSLSRAKGDDAWKRRKERSRAVDLTATLSRAQDALKEATADESIEGVYRKTWSARGRILSIQRKLEKITGETFTT
jgi:hypothetical protein